MSLINIATIENATDEVKEIFNEIKNTFGSVPNGIAVWSASPTLLKRQWAGIKETLSKDSETQKLYAIIRYLTSNENECTYCIGFNGGMLINYFAMTQDELISMKENPKSAPLDEKNKALLLFAMQSVKDANSITQDNIVALTNLGISEQEIFEIVHAASHMFVVNTLFKTFKVEDD